MQGFTIIDVCNNLPLLIKSKNLIISIFDATQQPFFIRSVVVFSPHPVQQIKRDKTKSQVKVRWTILYIDLIKDQRLETASRSPQTEQACPRDRSPTDGPVRIDRLPGTG